jgi:flagellar biosynthesis/type III secretory pathway protein FliH
MCLTEYDEQKNLLWFKEDGFKEGKEEGRKEGEIRFGKLIDKMVVAGRIDDMTRVATKLSTGISFIKNSTSQIEAPSQFFDDFTHFLRSKKAR